VLEADKGSLGVGEDVVVDVHEASDRATRLIRGCPVADDLVVGPWLIDALDLLPGWYDDWVITERERLRQRFLHALEVLSGLLIAQPRGAEAVDAAMTAVCAEPLRESAQRVLMAAHQAEGNLGEARRAHEAYRVLVRRELGTEPPPDLLSWVRPVAATAS
jgi:DNA-binding SARP family transcriptional activator